MPDGDDEKEIVVRESFRQEEPEEAASGDLNKVKNNTGKLFNNQLLNSS